MPSVQGVDDEQPYTPSQFEACLRAIGARYYHDNHPFHHLLHKGKLNKGQVQAWALNRYYYQVMIPVKDVALMSKMADPCLRRIWMKRVLDHEGRDGLEGGIERWYKLTDGLGLMRDYVMSTAGILPSTRFAVDAYVRFVRERPLLEGVTSSLTELFAPSIHEERIAGMLGHYDFADDEVLSYFRKRLTQAPDDAAFVLDYAIKNARTRSDQESVCAALKFKTDVLWVMLDALYHAYINGFIPEGAFMPEDFDVRPRFRK
ncbi:MAG: pyrroloquinoline-quinone synthase PqqC [Alphaproteobacteria bacterium GM7ARS4]|nr:pyrroloquinoline-quinone synthase PqqC [Alphaproteobacteria bacterium GM7ARS4]